LVVGGMKRNWKTEIVPKKTQGGGGPTRKHVPKLKGGGGVENLKKNKRTSCFNFRGVFPDLPIK